MARCSPMALAAYFDASGTHHGSSVMAFAAYVADVDQWQRFDAEWRDMLNRYELKVFHMTDCESLLGEFKGWTVQKKKTFLSSVVAKILLRARFGFSYSVNLHHFAEIIGGRYEDRLGNPFVFCLGGLLREIAYWCDTRQISEDIAYFIEQGDDQNQYVASLMATAQEQENLQRFRVRSWTFGSKVAHTPLQAADFLAFESYKHWRNTEVAGEKRPQRVTLNKLLGHPHRGVWISREGMEQMVSILTETGELPRTTDNPVASNET